MKKRILLASSLALLQLSGAEAVFAGGVENVHNYSAEYIRTFNRNAATDSADIVVYNPAGTVLMDDGSYLNLSMQYLDKDYKNIVSGNTVTPANNGTYSSDEPSIIPGLFGLYKKDKWSVYTAVTVISGGGKVDFERGSATLQIISSANLGGTALVNPKTEAESVGMGITIGGAYKVCESASLSFGIRHLKSDSTVKNSFEHAAFAPLHPVAEYEAEASGWAGIFGINYKPTDELNLAARYEMKTRLDYDYTVTSVTNLTGQNLLDGETPPIVTGLKKRKDLPALLGLGGSYQMTPALKVDVNLTYYFQEDADWAGAENNVDNGYEVGIAFEYSFNEKLRGSVGYMHTETGIDAQYTLIESPKLDANSLGTGFAYSFNDNFEMNAGVGIVTYNDDSYAHATGLTIGFEKQVIFYSIGGQYKF